MKIMAIAFVAIIGLASGGYAYWTSTPEYALYQIKDSVIEKNKAKFEGYVDVKRITGSIVDEIAQMTLAESTKNKNGWAVLGGMFAAKMIETMKPQIETMAEKEIAKIFEADRNVASASHEKNQFANFSNARSSLTYLNYEKRDCSDQVCYFNIHFKHEITQSETTFKAKLEKINGNWKLVELPSLIEQIKKLKT